MCTFLGLPLNLIVTGLHITELAQVVPIKINCTLPCAKPGPNQGHSVDRQPESLLHGLSLYTIQFALTGYLL